MNFFYEGKTWKFFYLATKVSSQKNQFVSTLWNLFQFFLRVYNVFSVCYLSDVSLLNELYWHLGDISMNMKLDIFFPISPSFCKLSHSATKCNLSFCVVNPLSTTTANIRSFANDWANSQCACENIWPTANAAFEWKFD